MKCLVRHTDSEKVIFDMLLASNICHLSSCSFSSKHSFSHDIWKYRKTISSPIICQIIFWLVSIHIHIQNLNWYCLLATSSTFGKYCHQSVKMQTTRIKILSKIFHDIFSLESEQKYIERESALWIALCEDTTRQFLIWWCTIDGGSKPEQMKL